MLVDGTRVAASTREALVRRMGYVVQDGGLYPHLTAATTSRCRGGRALAARADRGAGRRAGRVAGLDAAMLAAIRASSAAASASGSG